MSKLDPIYDRVVALAQAHRPPRAIAAETGIDPDDVYAVIRRARERGVAIPYFAPKRSELKTGERHRIVASPKVATPPRPWTAADDARVAELLVRGRRLTEIAAMLRRPYAMVIAAADRHRAARAAP